jgi:hypothetical protein
VVYRRKAIDCPARLGPAWKTTERKPGTRARPGWSASTNARAGPPKSSGGVVAMLRSHLSFCPRGSMVSGRQSTLLDDLVRPH